METTRSKEDVAAIGKRMAEIMFENKGKGLAANQVGLQERIFVMQDANGTPITFANPTIVSNSPGMNDDYEGCLSFPMQRVKIRRFSQVTVEYDDPDGYGRITKEYDDLEARCVQHEIDHLDGILLMDHINSNLGLKSFLEKYAKDFKQARRKGLYL